VGWDKGSYQRVAVHVRRGDFLRDYWIQLGTTVVDERYIGNTIDYFVTRHRRVQFVVTSDDYKWTRHVFSMKFGNISNSTAAGKKKSYSFKYLY
jgi:Glycosyl transferase family 11